MFTVATRRITVYEACQANFLNFLPRGRPSRLPQSTSASRNSITYSSSCQIAKIPKPLMEDTGDIVASEHKIYVHGFLMSTVYNL